METELQAARTLLYAAAVQVTENAPDKVRFAAMAKRFATDTGSSLVDRELQPHGGYGHLYIYPIAPCRREQRAHLILESTTHVMWWNVARAKQRPCPVTSCFTQMDTVDAP